MRRYCKLEIALLCLILASMLGLFLIGSTFASLSGSVNALSGPSIVNVGITAKTTTFPPETFLRARPGDSFAAWYDIAYSGPRITTALRTTIIDPSGKEIRDPLGDRVLVLMEDMSEQTGWVDDDFKIPDTAVLETYSVRFSVWSEDGTQEYASTTKSGWLTLFAGAEPDIRPPAPSIDFDDVVVGESRSGTRPIWNNGSATLIVNSATRTSGSSDFTYVEPSTPFDIPAGQAHTITIRFAPSSEGIKDASFTINSNDPDEANVNLSVSGRGVPAPTPTPVPPTPTATPTPTPTPTQRLTPTATPTPTPTPTQVARPTPNTVEVANLSRGELNQLREVIEEVIKKAKVVARPDVSRLLNQAEATLSKLESGVQIRDIVREKTEKERLALDFLGGIFSVGAEHFYRIPSPIAGALAKGAEELGNLIGQWLELKHLGLAEATMPDKSSINILFQKQQREVWANISVPNLDGQISLYVPVKQSGWWFFKRINPVIEKAKIAYRLGYQREEVANEAGTSFPIIMPKDPDTARLAAIVYAEAQALPVIVAEMQAIASVVRNRVEHVDKHPIDKNLSFCGPGYESVIKCVNRDGKVQFNGYYVVSNKNRYIKFLSGSVDNKAEQEAANQAIDAATTVRNFKIAPYKYVFFQKSGEKQSYRADDTTRVKLGAHYFWAFRPECVDPKNTKCK